VIVPARFFDVEYNAERYPGAPSVVGADLLHGGANCQLFAYELLRANGLCPPALRSSELWSDEAATEVVHEFEPLDLLLFNRTPDAYGAHVAVYVGDGRAIHLSRSVGRAAIWTIDEFLATPEYRCLIGAKRVRARSIDPQNP